ncbi:SAM-dependent methyltransferase [Novosphingobium endophyticum]|uniref:SAM-dependent methyltransferase n=1 Tax=Novosphingobium endophyticum TaxID=1955250 RepID=A0A916TQV8_9SPHN|nr:class I SAM-dependent methyltransferase [Novosphingobium endophyticum]GGB95752.1 SAM-dependent methyltransferase [Novosphingobium endophyticum]
MATTSPPQPAPAGGPDMQKLEQFMHKMVGDMGAAMSGSLVITGSKLGLYKALAEMGAATDAQLAGRLGLDTRYVREWLSAQAASGFVDYDPGEDTFSLNAEQQMALANEDSPVYVAPAFELIASAYIDEPKITDAFRTGKGVGWHEHHECLFRGTERFFRPGYRANLVSNWLPALDGVTDKLEAGAKVADIGCGAGASTIIMAQAFPNSRFTGFDYHEKSISRAREAAKEAGDPSNISFEIASAKDAPGSDYDLVCVFDALHDMGDPVGAARRVLEMLKPDGTFMIVEPYANDSLAENLNPVGRMYYSASTMICTPGSKAQEVGLALGAQAGEGRLTQVLKEAGFGSVRRAAETPFNLVIEARC